LLYDTNNGYNLQNKVYYLLNKLFFLKAYYAIDLLWVQRWYKKVGLGCYRLGWIKSIRIILQ